MRAASERTSNQSNQNQGQNDVSEPSHTSWVSPTSGVDSLDLRIPSRANSTGEPCAGPAFPNQTRHTPQESEMTSIFESFLLWPLDDASEHYNISSINPSGTSAPSGIARTLNPSTNVSLGAEAAMTLAPFQQRTSRHATLPVSPGSSSTQTGYRVTEDAITEEDRDILISEDYGHVPRPSTSVYEEICAFHAEVSWCSPDGPLPRLYTLEILHVCTQLYFEHFHRSFPVLHQGTFEVRSESWLLYLAVAAVGSQYSRLSIRTKLFSNLVTIIRESLLRKLSSAVSLQNNLELAQATLLFNLALLMGGTREGIMHVQYQRSVLVTMCRPLLIPGVLFEQSHILSTTSMLTEDWSRWIVTESWKRLAYFTWVCECLQLVFFDLPPLITASNMHLNMPCNDDLWQCVTFHDWERAKGSQKECPSVLSLLKTEVINQEYVSLLSDSALWISVLAAYVAERDASQQRSLHLYPDRNGISDYSSLPSLENVHTSGQNRNSIDTVLGHFQQAVTEHRQNSPVLHVANKFSLVLRIFASSHTAYCMSPPGGWRNIKRLMSPHGALPSYCRQNRNKLATVFYMLLDCSG
ncbi:transcriptional regulator family: Fungal Specific TF [Paecilomyces variotii]|nr:transcriptional regulator family: Fungal Specific TF [Paecilomyces variotii]